MCRDATARGQLTEESMVLVRDDGHPRLQLPVSVVTKTFPGRDGVIRTVQVRTAKGTYTRSIQLLHDLELSDTQQYVTRYGRSVRPGGRVTNGRTILRRKRRHILNVNRFGVRVFLRKSS